MLNVIVFIVVLHLRLFIICSRFSLIAGALSATTALASSAVLSRCASASPNAVLALAVAAGQRFKGSAFVTGATATTAAPGSIDEPAH